MTIIEELHAQMSAIEEKIIQIQSECSHPLAARKSENKGSSGNWDKSDDCYWTNHHCTLCDKRWSTGQRWKYEGDGRGMPDEQAVR